VLYHDLTQWYRKRNLLTASCHPLYVRVTITRRWRWISLKISVDAHKTQFTMQATALWVRSLKLWKRKFSHKFSCLHATNFHLFVMKCFRCSYFSIICMPFLSLGNNCRVTVCSSWNSSALTCHNGTYSSASFGGFSLLCSGVLVISRVQTSFFPTTRWWRRIYLAKFNQFLI
jgi:hypothetical protein